VYLVGGTVVRETRDRLSSQPPLSFATGSAAFVGDYSFFGFTSPVAGGRYRFEVTPSFGSINFTTAVADYRRYVLAKPLTFAVRAMHVGRYGSGARSSLLQPLFVGQPYLLRGYDAGSIDVSECTASAADDCPEFSRLTGSRLAIASAELRIPVLGNDQFGLIPFSILPLEISPFVDAGLAWSGGDDVSLRFARNSAERVPVVSAGVTARANVFGYAVLEVFWAKPFQRPQRGGVVGFQLQPGW
jgi:outer membrane protein assembly factor BamA